LGVSLVRLNLASTPICEVAFPVFLLIFTLGFEPIAVQIPPTPLLVPPPFGGYSIEIHTLLDEAELKLISKIRKISQKQLQQMHHP
jgi:hypothetical protein